MAMAFSGAAVPAVPLASRFNQSSIYALPLLLLPAPAPRRLWYRALPLHFPSYTIHSQMNVAASLSSSSSPSPVDFALFSVGLLFMYWVGNFVVPDIIVKGFNKDKAVNDAEDVKKDVFYDSLVGGGGQSVPDDLVGMRDLDQARLDRDTNIGFGKESKKPTKGRKRN